MAKLPILYIKRGGGGSLKKISRQNCVVCENSVEVLGSDGTYTGYLLGPVVVQLLQTVCEMALTSLTHQPPGL